jgi:hypothetical protein
MDACCAGINGSHTLNCPQHWNDGEMACWCCGALFVTGDDKLTWGPLGCRCVRCEKECETICRSRVTP